MDQLVQFQVNCPRIAVLRVLDEKHHQKGDNRCASIDDQLPGIRIVKDGTADRPDQNDRDCADKSPTGAEIMRAFRGKFREPVGAGNDSSFSRGGFLFQIFGYFDCHFSWSHLALCAETCFAATLRSATRLAISASLAWGSGIRRIA